MTSRIQSTRRRKDVNRLRGQSARSRSIVIPDPIRHFLSESPIDRKTHEQCFSTTSSSLSHYSYMDNNHRYRLTQGHYSDMDNNQRYRLTQGYIPVNTNRHAACSGPRPIDNERPRTRHRMLSEKTLSKSVAYCPDLTKGEKLYLYNISRVYSTKNMHDINQRKYATVLSQEEQTGRYKQRDINKYWNYIRSPRQTSWGSGKSSFTPTRTKSAPPGKRRTKKIERPQTRMEELSDYESQDTPRGTQEEQASKKKKGIIETVLAEPEDRKSETGSYHSRGSKNSNTSKTRRRRSSSRASSSSSSRSRSSSSSSSSRSSRRSSSSDTETKHKRASDGETVVQRAKDESQNKESDTQESRATDNEMTGRPDARASDTGVKDTSRRKTEAYSSMPDSRGNDSHLREGHGRPKSRFGRKDAHKDDDDDSDSISLTSKSSSSSSHSSNADKAKPTKTSKKPMDKIEEKTKIESTYATTTEANQQRECDTSVSESRDYSQITTTTDHSTSVSCKHESESSQKATESKKKTTKSRYMESRRTRTNSESSLTQSISSNKSSDKKPRQRKSSRTSIKSNGSIKKNPTAESGKQVKTEATTKLENVIEDGEQVKTRTTYRSISIESQLKTGDCPSNDKDVDKIEY
ncbi:hypothetical protein LOTGIDRAFT_228342 [Lottia gigantea]|uniref:Uncharacterized protein n=1 Tax=Lottia gigantea TaxID=225164 RepID=V4A1R9_LOTGI|nr:hypothetical protein LOTGIDRAFT_228342 [Lottia gigantea]ESO97778.1 hypothetical protein LOTGIDRAFT_228342 [Lottia gigantea]